MNKLKDNQAAVQASKIDLANAEEELYLQKNRLRTMQDQLANVLRQGEAGVKSGLLLQRQISVFEAQIEKNRLGVERLNVNLDQLLRAFPKLDRPQDLIEELSDSLPFLLLPVRIETRFMTVNSKKELWVRIFPDDIAANSHEKNLTRDELEAAQNYWREMWTASQENDKEAKENIEKGTWRALAESFGGTRAAWISKATKPTTIDVSSVDSLVFPAFDPETLKEESWSMAPRSNVMPDRFVITANLGEQKIPPVIGNLIPSPLVLGPDPQKAEDEYQQQDGELQVGDDIEWIYNFDKAVDVGMGMKIPLVEPFASKGFTRLSVLGLRLQTSDEENKALLEELFESHHYAPDGLSVLAQGTPTNNTDNKGSGFSSRDVGAENSYKIEAGDALIQPEDEPLNKSDGQRLVEALGIGLEPFQHIQNAGQHDIASAMRMNKALWHGTLGYYLEEMLEFDLTTVGLVREFFTDFVTARGPLPAIRVGTQPYGVLLTSDFSAWKWSRKEDGDRFPFLERLQEIANKTDLKWQELLTKVAHVGGLGDPYENLLSILGLSAASVEYHRREALGKETMWNLESFLGSALGPSMAAELKNEAAIILSELGFDFEDMPRLFELPFFRSQLKVTDPIVDDILDGEEEKISEFKFLNSTYKIVNIDDPDSSTVENYISWLAHSSHDDIRSQQFNGEAGEKLPVPRPLMYRMLRGAFLQANYDTTMKLYARFGLVPEVARREVELSNIEEERTVTRWDFMGANISRVMPELSQETLTIGDFLQTDVGIKQPEALGLNEVRKCLSSLSKLSTADLERVFSEHIDVCSYRLDAWQMGCFNRRLQQQRYPKKTKGAFDKRLQGVHLGAFGWVENLTPSKLVPAKQHSLSTELYDRKKDGPLFEQENNAGFIHGPSLNHATTAAMLRNAYMSHFDPADPEKMAVNLSSERVRTSLDFLDGIRNGQELGAMLGYRFERGLHDRYSDPSLNQFIENIRQEYPMVADKITDDNGELVNSKESFNVLDGYALLEVAFLRETPLTYPYDVTGLPNDENSAQAKAIIAEVSRMADDMDAIKDLAIAEGVFQVTQGNFDRAGATLKAFTEGNNPIDPEIVKTPRGGSALTMRMVLQLETNGDSNSWQQGQGASPRAAIEPRLNKWLADLLPSPDNIVYTVQLGEGASVEHNLIGLGIEPIDLIYLIGDDLNDEMSELESRIAQIHRRNAGDDTSGIKIKFMNQLIDPQKITLFELLPLLRNLRNIVTGCRPLAADDFSLPAEVIDTGADTNPKGYEVDKLKNRLASALTTFGDAVQEIDNPNLDLDQIRVALITLANYGIADAFPQSVVGDSDGAIKAVTQQASKITAIAKQKLESAEQLKGQGDVETLLVEDRVAKYVSSIKEIFGPSFNLIPSFTMKNPEELKAATEFRNLDTGLTRHHKDNPFITSDWLQGFARVHEKVGRIEAIMILAEAIDKFSLNLKPLQLPFREKDYWVAMSYPKVELDDIDKPDAFIPNGDYLSLVQLLPESGFDPSLSQSGFMVDECVEVIPNQVETSGIAVHFNQPSTEPPQAMLLAVTPEVTGAWTWEKLMGVLNNTLDRAKLRAIEPEHIDDSAFSQLLPAVLSAVSSNPDATISTDYIHETAIKTSIIATDDG